MMHQVMQSLSKLDRRWIFLAMLICVGVPVLRPMTSVEKPGPHARSAFAEMEDLPDGSLLFCALDYDPSSAGELDPMTDALLRHAGQKKHRLIFMTLWPAGGPMIGDKINFWKEEFPELEYGVDYVNLGYQAGEVSVMRTIANSLEEAAPADVFGTKVTDIPLTANVKSLADVDLIVNVSAGFPGSKEWIQFAATRLDKRLISGVTGVMAPQLYPYYPEQMQGMIGAIKGAAEYEALLAETYPGFGYESLAKASARKRMGPQLFAHLLMIGLIVLGNIVFFWERLQGPPPVDEDDSTPADDSSSKSNSYLWWAVGLLVIVLALMPLHHPYGMAYVQVSKDAKGNITSIDDVTPPQKLKAEENDTVPAEPSPAEPEPPFEEAETADATAEDTPTVSNPQISYIRTAGLWLAAFFTISIYSFLYRDNPLYKFAESCMVGVSAAYWMLSSFWQTLVPKLLFPLYLWFKNLGQPGREMNISEIHGLVMLLIPLILGFMLLMRISPVGGWIARWPLALVVGSFMGMQLTVYAHADLVKQVNNTIVPLVDTEATNFSTASWAWFAVLIAGLAGLAYAYVKSERRGLVLLAGGILSLIVLGNQFGGPFANNVILLVGVLSALVYFFFSIEHTGAVGRTARLGIWVLMITFGAQFGFTVMGRIALLAERLQYLLDDWLWLVA